jgi:hypothetical protein
MTVGRLTQIVLECVDAEQLARFWQAVLNLPEPKGGLDGLTLRWEPVGRFSFHRVANYRPPAWPSVESSMCTSTSSSTIYATPASWSRRQVGAL